VATKSGLRMVHGVHVNVRVAPVTSTYSSSLRIDAELMYSTKKMPQKRQLRFRGYRSTTEARLNRLRTAAVRLWLRRWIGLRAI